MKVLVIGSGGREHALAWKLAQSPRVNKVYVAPGNAGTAHESRCENVRIRADNLRGLLDFALSQDVDLTLVGPEQPLVLGITDLFTLAGLKCFGPSQTAAQLEGSKAFSKNFLARHHIPTAGYRTFVQTEAALKYLRERGVPIVVKADGLAAGKGVVVAQTPAAAEHAVRDMLAGNAFGEAGHRVVIEDFLEGEEASFIVMADGEHVLPLATSQDHKRVGEGDTGPNTGGMGAYSPAPVLTPAIERRVMDTVILPTLAGMAAAGTPFTGFLYAGLMIAPDGGVRVLEFNARLGDPETQPLLLRLRSDLVDLIEAALDGQLDRVGAEWDTRPALGVVLAAHGYPGSVRTGDALTGLDTPQPEGVKLFHAGTQPVADGRVVSSGGRVLTSCALGDTLAEAREAAYAALTRVHLHGGFYRHDIGFRALHRD